MMAAAVELAAVVARVAAVVAIVAGPPLAMVAAGWRQGTE